MAEKFDRYYEYYSRRRRGPRTINLGLVKLNLGGRPSIEVRGIPRRPRGPPGGTTLETAEGEDVALKNAVVQRVAGRRVKLYNCDADYVEGEEVTLINTHAKEVTATRAKLINSHVKVLRYRESYTATNSVVEKPEKIAEHQRGRPQTPQ
ncbi:hypothetical protein [Pyrobaculum neutrophilum]|uniref:Uncharacterized protein n=1 Tax=Pyrobaculum neutrophilum (strain DSM 2338 / JCM 9278 / NBRC 100436 / V24Sta) TaxID=444157 RepID=B1YE22_PYRNV|nr:hypothetical protein [Pyrobaculum neutrophilum]ACB40035.1 conserved hypothetical protein [Pyrobaculum neutrophilum V24Sta]